MDEVACAANRERYESVNHGWLPKQVQIKLLTTLVVDDVLG